MSFNSGLHVVTLVPACGIRKYTMQCYFCSVCIRYDTKQSICGCSEDVNLITCAYIYIDVLRLQM